MVNGQDNNVFDASSIRLCPTADTETYTMNTKAMRIARSNGRCATDRRRSLLLAATYGLTSSLIAPTLHAAHCSTRKNDHGTNTFLVTSALPFIGDRGVQIKPSSAWP